MSMLGFAFYNILRDDSLDSLKSRDADCLRAYQTMLKARIAAKQQMMMRPNLLSNERSELAEDIRWYQAISQKIAALLTVEFHQKAA